MDIELIMSVEELSSIKGGEWYYDEVTGRWIRVAENIMDDNWLYDKF